MLVDAFFSFISSAAIVKLLKEYQRPNTQFRTNGINLKKLSVYWLPFHG